MTDERQFNYEAKDFPPKINLDFFIKEGPAPVETYDEEALTKLKAKIDSLSEKGEEEKAGELFLKFNRQRKPGYNLTESNFVNREFIPKAAENLDKTWTDINYLADCFYDLEGKTWILSQDQQLIARANAFLAINHLCMVKPENPIRRMSLYHLKRDGKTHNDLVYVRNAKDTTAFLPDGQKKNFPTSEKVTIYQRNGKNYISIETFVARSKDSEEAFITDKVIREEERKLSRGLDPLEANIGLPQLKQDGLFLGTRYDLTLKDIEKIREEISWFVGQTKELLDKEGKQQGICEATCNQMVELSDKVVKKQLLDPETKIFQLVGEDGRPL